MGRQRIQQKLTNQHIITQRQHGWEYGKNEAYGDSYQGYGAEAKRERAKKGGYRALTAYDDEYHAHNGYEEARGYGSEEKGAKAWKGKGGRKDSYYGAEVKREHEGYYGEQVCRLLGMVWWGRSVGLWTHEHSI